MKRITYILMILLVVLLKYTVDGQTTNSLYQFVTEADGKALTLRNDVLSFETQKTGVAKYNQLFMLKRKANTGKVYVVAASDPELFLKRNGNAVLAATFNLSNESDFEWEINFAGIPFLTIAKPGFARETLSRQGANLSISTIPVLVNNNDTNGENHRLEMVKVTSTF